MALPRLLGPYLVKRVLGRGGMGVVYQAEHADTGEEVAVKTVNLRRQDRLASLRREIHQLSRLRHPSVVRILGQGVDDGAPWYAMELLKGESLRRFVGKPRAATLPIARRLCAALAYLHGEGIVHRDLKPENVIVRDDGVPVVLDFGLTTQFGGEVSREVLDVASGTVGTIWYMAPEQARGELCDARADLYALGCILFELFTGRPPFVAQDAVAVVFKHLSEAPPRASTIDRSIPPELDALIDRLLQKDRRARLGHAAAVAVALGASPEEGVGARPYLYRPELAGRRDVLARIEERLDGLLARSDGFGGVLFVAGESGAGKTRLGLAIAEACHFRGLEVLSGECPPPVVDGPRIAAPLSAFARVMETISDRCQELGEGEWSRLLGKRGPILAPCFPSIATLPGEATEPPPSPLDLKGAQLRTLHALHETLLALADDEPLVILLDDLQWSDDVSLAFLEAQIHTRGLERARILIVGLTRPEDAPEALTRILGDPQASSLSLGRLSEDDVSSIVGDMLAMSPVPQTLVRTLARHAEGNPFFVAEHLRTLVDIGALDRDGAGIWRLTDVGQLPGELPLPPSVRELMGARLDRLTSKARIMVDLSAVLGREVDRDVVRALAGLTEAEALDAEADAFSRHVLEDGRGASLRFVHDRIREAAYTALEPARRRALHGACAGRLSEQGRGDGSAALVASHWERAGEPGEASRAYVRAARHASGRNDLAAAERFYRSALALATPAPEEGLRVRLELEEVLRISGATEQAAKECETALRLSREIGDGAAEVRIMRTLADLLRLLGEPGRARQLLDDACAMPGGLGDQAAAVLLSIGILEEDVGHSSRARALYEEGRKRAHAAADQLTEARALGGLGNLLGNLGQWDESERFFAAAADMARAMGNRPYEGDLLNNRASLLQLLGRFDEARLLYEAAIVVARETGHRRLLGISLGNLATIHQVQGRFGAARQLYEHALSIAMETRDRRAEADARINLAGLAALDGDLDDAEKLCDRARALHRRAPSLLGEGQATALLGEIRMAQGRDEEARHLLERALTLEREVHDRLSEGKTTLLISRLQAAAGRFEEAAQSIDSARRIADEAANPHLRGLAALTAARIARLRGSSRAAVAESLREAEAMLSNAADPILLATLACERGHALLQEGHPAWDLLEQARSLSSPEWAPEGEIGLMISELARAIDAFEKAGPAPPSPRK